MPNVLILKSDEHCARASSIYGHSGVDTPNLERLAAMGTTYDAAYCPSPLCVPSRSSFLTGRPVHEIQCYNNSMAVPRPNFPTYGASLASQGVHTAYVGKVHAYRPASELGFTEMFANDSDFPSPGDPNIQRVPPVVSGRASSRLERYGVQQDAFVKDDVRVHHALDFLDRSADLSTPWTLDVNLLAPHFPHFATEELWERYAGRGDLPEYGVEEESAHHPYAEQLRQFFQTDEYDEELTRAHRRGYYGRVTYVDTQLGRLLDKLEETGQLESTVVVYTSDHGEMLGTFGMWFKCSMYEDSVRVPLVVAGPGFEQGVRASIPVTHWDLNASIFTATEADRPSLKHGVSLQDLALDDADRAVFAEYHGHGTSGSAFMVRRGKWKFVYNALAPHQLYDLTEDPHELRNLAADNPAMVEDLTSCLRDEFCDPEAEHERAEAFIQQQLAVLRDLPDPVH